MGAVVGSQMLSARRVATALDVVVRRHPGALDRQGTAFAVSVPVLLQLRSGYDFGQHSQFGKSVWRKKAVEYAGCRETCYCTLTTEGNIHSPPEDDILHSDDWTPRAALVVLQTSDLLLQRWETAVGCVLVRITLTFTVDFIVIIISCKEPAVKLVFTIRLNKSQHFRKI